MPGGWSFVDDRGNDRKEIFLNLDGEIGLHLFGIFSLDQLNQIRIGYQGSINGEEPKGFVEGLCE